MIDNTARVRYRMTAVRAKTNPRRVVVPTRAFRPQRSPDFGETITRINHARTIDTVFVRIKFEPGGPLSV